MAFPGVVNLGSSRGGMPSRGGARAQFRVGDELVRLQGQPILSTADVQWVLHNAGDKDELVAEVRRDGAPVKLMLVLPDGWRRKLPDWRFINMGIQRNVIGFNCRPTSQDDTDTDKPTLAMRVQNANRRQLGKLDIRRGDLVVAVDGSREPMTLGAWTALVFRDKKPGDKMTLTVRRGDRERDLEVTIR